MKNYNPAFGFPIAAMLAVCGIAYCNKWIKIFWLKL